MLEEDGGRETCVGKVVCVMLTKSEGATSLNYGRVRSTAPYYRTVYCDMENGNK
jgi:hypothetical protein